MKEFAMDASTGMLGRWPALAAVMVAMVLAASCGGGSGPGPATVTSSPAAASAAPMQPLTDSSLGADQAMDWAEAHYPQLFPTAGKSAGYFAPYSYRYYPASGNYLGVSIGGADVAVYLHGNVTGGRITRLAALREYTCTVLPQNCGPLSNNIAMWGDSQTPPIAANLQVLIPGRVVYDGGIAAQDSIQVSARQRTDADKLKWVQTLWFGHVNETNPSQVKADIAASVAALADGNTRFIVISLLNEDKPEELKGGPVYNTIVQLNKDLAAAYPDNYLDIRSYLVSHYNPSVPQDVIDFQNDVMPFSLRHDEGHLNNDGSVLVARRIQEFINAKGW
jgi:hypothetical protein